jgi:hypothetical protein
MKTPRDQQLRQRLAREAARLMHEEGIKEYFNAKRTAARRLLGRHQGRAAVRFHPRDLPSNGEIREALLEQVELMEGHLRAERLFAMRVVAWETMRALEGFDPRLIGSVSTGHVRRGSDIDLHVFTDEVERLERHVHALGWTYELETVSIRKNNAIKDYTHLHIGALFPVEVTVYPWSERRVLVRSSTDGRPIVRRRAEKVEALLRDEHPQAWARYLELGRLDDAERWEAEADAEGWAHLEGLLGEEDEEDGEPVWA